MYEDFLAERLCELRQQRNISAREMSLALGQNDSYINRIENRKTFPSMQSFFYICEYLHVSPAEFFEKKNEAPAVLSEICSELKKCNVNQLTTLLAFLKTID